MHDLGYSGYVVAQYSRLLTSEPAVYVKCKCILLVIENTTFIIISDLLWGKTFFCLCFLSHFMPTDVVNVTHWAFNVWTFSSSIITGEKVLNSQPLQSRALLMQNLIPGDQFSFWWQCLDWIQPDRKSFLRLILDRTEIITSGADLHHKQEPHYHPRPFIFF